MVVVAAGEIEDVGMNGSQRLEKSVETLCYW